MALYSKFKITFYYAEENHWPLGEDMPYVHNLHFQLGTAFEYVVLSICQIDCIIWAFSEYFRSLVNHASLIFEDIWDVKCEMFEQL